MKKNKLKILTLALATAMLIGMGQSVLAHTRLEVPTRLKASESLTIWYGHACGEKVLLERQWFFLMGWIQPLLVNGQPHVVH